MVYHWGYSVATAGDVLLTQTLPEGMSWVIGESVAACAEGADAVSADGRTLSCTRANQATGASTYQVRAMVDHGANGQVMSTVLTSPGATDSAAADVTVSAAPMIDVATSAGTVGYKQWNGVGGQRVNFGVYLYQRIDANRGIRGTEGLSDTFSFVLDASDMGASAQVDGNCRVDGGNYLYGTKIGGVYTAENSVVDGGTWTCAQSAPGAPITVTVTGAVTDARSYPTSIPTNGWKPPADHAYLSIGIVTLWIPNSEYPTARSMQVMVEDFDPVSLSGQSNYGDGYTRGQEPGAALISGVNGNQFTFATGAGMSYGMQRTYAATGQIGYTDPIADGGTTVTAGDSPMFPGQTLRFGGYIGPKSSDGSVITNLTVCGVWDEDRMTGGSVDWRYIQITGIEYAHLELSTDAERRAVDCGTVGDGQAGWSTTRDGVTGGADAVNAVRYVWAEVPSAEAPYGAISLTRTTEPLSVGTSLGVFFQARADQIALTKSTLNPASGTPTGLGALARAAEAETSVQIDWDAAASDPGVVRTVAVRPHATVAEGVTATATGVSVAVTLPGNVSMVADSWPDDQAPTGTTTNGDGSITYVFPFGDIAANTEVEALEFSVAISSRIEMPSSIMLTAVVSSDGDPRAASYRTDTSALIINSPSAFSASMTAPVSYAVPGQPVTYTVSWFNGLTATAGVGKIVDVLPFDGDGRGTDGLSSLTLDSVTIDADMAVQVQYTTQSSAAATAAVTADRSGDTGITWVDIAAGLNPPANTTALRFVTGDIDPGLLGQAVITVTPGSIPQDGLMVNDLSGTVELITQPIENVAPVRLTSGAIRLAGTVYQDDDYSFSMDEGEAGVAGVTVMATGYTFGANGIDDGGAGDDVVVNAADAVRATSDASGQYVLDGLAPGSWQMSIESAVDGLVPAEVPAATAVQTAGEAADLNLGLMQPIAAPVVADDAVRVSAGDAVTVDVLDNDTFDASAVITAVSEASAGAVSWSEGDETVEYTAAASGSGEVTFTYTVTDKARQSATGTVTVTVVPLPTATDMSVTVPQSATVIDLAGSFTGDGAVISTDSVRASVSGATVTYTPAAGFSGADSFTYTVTDSMGKTAQGTVSVTVLQAPDLADDAASTLVVTPITIAVTENDPFVGDGTLAVATEPGSGSAVVDGLDVVYTPAAGFTGTDSFTYSVTDQVGQSDTAAVTVIVVDSIALTADTAKTGVASAVTVDVLANDVATEGQIVSVTQGANGSAEVVDGVVVYTPAADFAGADTFTYTVRDLAGNSATANVTVTVVAPPVSESIALRTGLNTPVQVDAAARVSGDAPTAAVTTTPESGQLTVEGGVLTFTPAVGFVGTVSATLTWTDSVGQTVTQDLTIEVVDAPVANDDWAETTLDTPVTVDLLANDQGEALLAVVDSPEHGTAIVDADGVLTYTPAAGWSGSAVMRYTITDALGQNATATVTVDVYAPPTAPHLTARTGVGMGVVFDAVAPATRSLAANAVTVTAVGTTDAGQTTLNEDGTIGFVPAATFIGTASFIYTVTDHLGQSTEGTIEVAVIALTVRGIVEADTAFDTAVTVDVFSVVDGSSPSVSSVGPAAHGSVSVVDGQVVYTPATGWTGRDTFTVEVRDDLGQTVTVTVGVTTAEEAPTDPPVDAEVLAWTGTRALGLLGIAALTLALGVRLWLLARRHEARLEN